MIRSKIVNLTFGHNLCFKCPNGSCEPFYTSMFQELFNDIRNSSIQWGFDPCNCSLKIRESIRTPNSQSGSSLGSVRVHSLALSYTPRSMKCDSHAFFLAFTFANPCFGRKPKAWVTQLQ
jgi:hypothetical protein